MNLKAKTKQSTKQCWTNVEDGGPTLYKCNKNVLCLLGKYRFGMRTQDIDPMLV